MTKHAGQRYSGTLYAHVAAAPAILYQCISKPRTIVFSGKPEGISVTTRCSHTQVTSRVIYTFSASCRRSPKSAPLDAFGLAGICDELARLWKLCTRQTTPNWETSTPPSPMPSRLCWTSLVRLCQRSSRATRPGQFIPRTTCRQMILYTVSIAIAIGAPRSWGFRQPVRETLFERIPKFRLRCTPRSYTVPNQSESHIYGHCSLRHIFNAVFPKQTWCQFVCHTLLLCWTFITAVRFHSKPHRRRP